MRKRAHEPDKALETIYARLFAHFGPQHWWPAESTWEVMVGAILTQNTSWRNVEKALANLKRADRLEPDKMRRSREATIARLIRPSGYFNLKAKKLKALVEFLFKRFGGDPARLAGEKLEAHRVELLDVYGIGPETADSILLYAAYQPIFVIDAYTRRICARLGLASEDASYDELQRLFMTQLSANAAYYKKYRGQVKPRRKVSRKRVKPRRKPPGHPKPKPKPDAGKAGKRAPRRMTKPKKAKRGKSARGNRQT